MFVSWAGTSIKWGVARLSQEISEGGVNCEFQNGKGEVRMMSFWVARRFSAAIRSVRGGRL